VKIALIDYGAGNVPSVERALHKLGAESFRATAPPEVARADAIILPGVGHYAALIRGLEGRGLRSPLLEALARGMPFLGICLGLQSLYESSEEAAELAGLSVLPGRVRALPAGVKLPHMGWNRLHIRQASPLLTGISEKDYFYFAHTFAAQDSGVEVAATCHHGTAFAAVLQKERTFAVQFHPEKSGASGARLLQNFLRLAA
jgi:imidazole glycerol phosphate synthase glutamine amidotransferase subunit